MNEKEVNRPFHPDIAAAKNLAKSTTLIRNDIKSNGSIKKLANNTTNKKSTAGDNNKCCCCIISPGSAMSWASFLTNLGICTLLFGYTLLGSFIFLAIEGGASQMHQRTIASTNRQLKPVQSNYNNIYYNSYSYNVTLSPTATQDVIEIRNRCVERIWKVTEDLNILFRENWTRLAADEIAKLQDQLIKRIIDDTSAQMDTMAVSTNTIMIATQRVTPGYEYEWTFARAFLYSLTVLTTIGYSSVAPKTTLGRVVTLIYALLGIPLTLIYLSSTGGVLARIARDVFSRTLCCCLCSNCGYCCYDEKRMAEKERRMKKKRQLMESKMHQLSLQEPYYVRAGTLTNKSNQSPEKAPPTIFIHPQADADSVCSTESRVSMHGLSILAPICLCLCMMIIYIIFGALTLWRMEGWPLLDGIYFCFMALSTIGFGDLIPGLRGESAATLWFCSIYIMSGMALTAMCFNVLHDEIMCRIKYIIDANQKTHSMSYDNVLHLNQSLNGTAKSKLINESNAHNVTNGDYSNS